MLNETSLKSVTRELKRLHLKQGELIAELEARENGTTVTGFEIGDRVRIINGFKKPLTWNKSVRWDENYERNATVIKIDNGKVYIVTPNKIRTWRLPHNLKKL